MQYGKPSLVCDLQELYRYLVDDFMIQFCQDLKDKDFTVKSENVSRSRKDHREYLNGAETRCIIKELNEYFESKVDIHFIRQGQSRRIETLIDEDVLILA